MFHLWTLYGPYLAKNQLRFVLQTIVCKYEPGDSKCQQ